MAEEKKEVKKTEAPKENTRLGMSLQDLKVELNKKEELKVQIEHNYYQVLGMIQMLVQQIATLEEQGKKSKKN